MAVKPEAQHLLQERIRIDFVNAIGKVAPEVVDDLHESVLPLYVKVVESADRPALEPREPDSIPIPPYEEDAGVEQALEEWAVRFNLNAGWILRAARFTLRLWVADSRSPKNALQYDHNVREFTADPRAIFGGAPEEEFEFHFPAWNPFLQSWESYVSDFDEPEGFLPGLVPEFEREVEDYRKRVEAWAVGLGYQTEARNITAEHIEWTILHHAKKLNYAQITDRTNRNAAEDASVKTESAIRKRVAIVANLIGLPPVPVRR